MRLLRIENAKKTVDPHVWNLVLLVQDEWLNEFNIAYTYNINNAAPMQEQIAKWLSENDLVPEPYTELDAVVVTLDSYREHCRSQVVIMCNALTQSTISYYPQAEVESWNIQKVEAETFLNAEAAELGSATLDMAPFVTAVCTAEFGAATDVERLSQVHIKCTTIRNNATAWAAVAAFVNGLRSRTQDLLTFSESLEEMDGIVTAARDQIHAFAAAYM